MTSTDYSPEAGRGRCSTAGSWNRRSRRRPRAEIEALQEARILDLVAYAWANSAFYRDLWGKAGVSPSDIKNLDDFTRLIPTFEKADTQAFRDRTGDPFGGLLCMPPEELTSCTATSGTTGGPRADRRVRGTSCLRCRW